MTSMLRLSLAGSLLVLAACGGAPQDNPNYMEKYGNTSSGTVSTGSSGSNSSSTSGSSSGGGNTITHLDCTQLDPDKVYIFGQLHLGFLTGTDVLFDPADPEVFCLGFPQALNEPLYISPNGGFVWADGFDILELVQESLVWDTDNDEWEYPDNPEINDVEIVPDSSTTADGAFLDLENNEVYYHNGRVIYVQGQEDIYYTLPLRGGIRGVVPGGRILYSRDSNLYILDADLTVTDLALPDGVSGTRDFYGPMKFAGSSHTSAWLYVVYSDDTEHRWLVDFSTDTVTIDGEFAALPDSIEVTTNSQRESRIDGGGNLWHISGETIDEIYYNIALKRPLAAGGDSTIEYSEANYAGNTDWQVEPNPYSHINHPYPLVTGP